MPAFKSSASKDFEPQVDETRVSNIDYDEQAKTANMNAHVAEFEAYQKRSDIEDRRSILIREQAMPGSINWRAQRDADGNLTNQHEVTSPNPFAPAGP
jgi:hypothetical protein